MVLLACWQLAGGAVLEKTSHAKHLDQLEAGDSSGPVLGLAMYLDQIFDNTVFRVTRYHPQQVLILP